MSNATTTAATTGTVATAATTTAATAITGAGTTGSCTVVLVKTPLTDKIRTMLEEKNVQIVPFNNETASDKQFNETKFLGTCCVMLNNSNIAVVQPNSNIKKSSFDYTFMKKIGGKVNYVFVNDDSVSTTVPTSHVPIIETTVSEFEHVTIPTHSLTCTMKVTCGLMCKEMYSNTVGHITYQFGVNCDEANRLYQDSMKHLNKTYDAVVIAVKVDNCEGGHVVWIPELGPTTHITINTSIKSVLSKNIVEMYNNSIFSFQLKQIDPTIKQDKLITIEKVANATVQPFDWYVYAV